MVKKAVPFVREASFVSRCRTGCGMFARYVSRFTLHGSASDARTRLADFFNILLVVKRYCGRTGWRRLPESAEQPSHTSGLCQGAGVL